MLEWCKECHLKHEGETVSRQALRLVAVLGCAALKCVRVRTVRRHAHMQARTCAATAFWVLDHSANETIITEIRQVIRQQVLVMHFQSKFDCIA